MPSVSNARIERSGTAKGDDIEINKDAGERRHAVRKIISTPERIRVQQSYTQEEQHR